MATKKQTSDTESTAAPKTTAANGKAGATKKPDAEKAAPPAEPLAAADAPKTTAKKTPAPKAQKPAQESVAGSVTPASGAAPATKAKAKAGSTSPAAGPSQSAVKVFGEVAASGSTFFIQKGSVPEGQLQLVIDKAKKQLADRIPGYNGQFVTVLGEYGKAKKTDKYPTFLVHNLASHDEVARRAYDLSHENPATVEDNWLRAENELLNG